MSYEHLSISLIEIGLGYRTSLSWSYARVLWYGPRPILSSGELICPFGVVLANKIDEPPARVTKE